MKDFGLIIKYLKIRIEISGLIKSNAFLLLAFWITIPLGIQNLCAQEFEGKIIYKVNWEPRPGKSEYLKTKKKQTYSEVFYKRGQLRILSDGPFPEIIYLSTTNTLYFINSDKKVASTANCAEETRRILHEEYLPEEIIMDKKCKGYLTEMGNDKHINYFDTSIHINPSYFKDYNSTHFNKVVQRFKSFPVKYIYKTDEYILTELATDVQYMFLSDSLFLIPDSIADFVKKNSEEPTYSSPFELNYNLGIKALENKNYQEAIKYFNKAFPGDPKNVDLLFNRALAKYNDEDKNGACKDWLKAWSFGDNESKKLYEQYCQ